MELILSFWGLLSLLIVAIILVIFDYSLAIAKAKDLIILAENNARQFALNNGEAKFKWVVNQYRHLPSFIKIAISEKLFAKIVQFTFDKIKDKLQGDK